MTSFKHAILALAVVLAIMLAQTTEAQPPQARETAVSAPSLAPAPNMEPYGWWYSKTLDSLGRGRSATVGRPLPAPASAKGSVVPDNTSTGPGGTANQSEKKTGGSGDGPGTTSQAASPKPKGETKTANAASPTIMPMAGGMPSGHSFAQNRSPVQSLYLAVVGAEMPESAPEVYYRFTARTLERHGGVALGSSWHRATVVRDGEAWRADILGASFGTVELYSRFQIGDRRIYSQHNYLHFLRSEDSEGLEMPAQTELPADWPQFIFPTSSYNDMPFRGAQTGQSAEFEIMTPPGRDVATAGLLLEENMPDSVKLGYSPRSEKFSFTPREDETLIETGTRGSKRAVAVVELPGSGDLMTFSLQVNRSRWSTRKLGLGIGLIIGVAGIIAFIVVRNRGRFKYNDRD